MKKIKPLLVMIPLVLFSCKQGDTTKKESHTSEASDAQLPQDYDELIGRKAILTYADFTAEVMYLSVDKLHWKTTNTVGIISEGDETISYKKVGDHLFFINWIEKDGLTVSQVIDTQKGSVDAFLSYADEASNQGKRSSDFMQGTFQFSE